MGLVGGWLGGAGSFPGNASATTPTAVREALVTAIEALTPTSVAASTFARYALEKPFEEWAAADPGHCFRSFDLRFEQVAGMPENTNGAESRFRYDFELTVAYPRAHYKTLDTPVLEIDQAIDEDFVELWPVLRDYIAATCVAEDADIRRETEGANTFLRITVPFEIWRTV